MVVSRQPPILTDLKSQLKLQFSYDQLLLIFHLIVLLFGGIGERSPVVILVLGLHPEANGELQQVGHEPVQ